MRGSGADEEIPPIVPLRRPLCERNDNAIGHSVANGPCHSELKARNLARGGDDGEEIPPIVPLRRPLCERNDNALGFSIAINTVIPS